MILLIYAFDHLLFSINEGSNLQRQIYYNQVTIAVMNVTNNLVLGKLDMPISKSFGRGKLLGPHKENRF
jgi:hypothetical protein